MLELEETIASSIKLVVEGICGVLELEESSREVSSNCAAAGCARRRKTRYSTRHDLARMLLSPKR